MDDRELAQRLDGLQEMCNRIYKVLIQSDTAEVNAKNSNERRFDDKEKEM